jgi:nitroreductase
MNEKIKEALEWRYAAKKFDATKSIAPKDLQTLKDSIRLAPTSYGLQPFKAIFIDDKNLREQLREKSWGQSQVTDASEFIVFVAQKNVAESDVDAYMENVASSRKIAIEDTKGFGDYIKGSIKPMTEEQFIPWNTKQTYIALGMLLQTAAELRIDTTPMEGFDVAAYDEILGLSEKGLTTTVVCALGYRHEEDANQHQAKVRKSEKDIFLTY